MNRYFTEIQLKHADWKYLLPPVILLILTGILSFSVATTHIGNIILIAGTLFIILIYKTHLYHKIRRDLRDQQRKNQAYQMLMLTLETDRPLPYMSDWSATPELSLAVCDEILHNEPDCVVELGSGTTTLITAMSLKKIGKGKVWAFDHQKEYVERTKLQLQRQKLTEWAVVHHAPLTTVESEVGKSPWYDLEGKIPDRKVGLLIIDGPPVKTAKLARFPALPMLWERLAESAVIILHDTHRPEESEVIKRWQEKYDKLQCINIDSEKGISVLYKGSADRSVIR